MADATFSPTLAQSRPKRPNPVLHFIRRQPLGFAGFLVILLYFGLAVGAYWISPFHPEEIDFSAMLTGPSREHPMGTDQYGRDVFSRLVYGARTAMAVGIISALLGCTAGALTVPHPAIRRSRRQFIQRRRHPARVPDHRAGDGGRGRARQVAGIRIDMNLIVAIALPMVPKMARIARASTLSIAQMPTSTPPVPPATATPDHPAPHRANIARRTWSW